jgi:hypothetical protein
MDTTTVVYWIDADSGNICIDVVDTYLCFLDYAEVIGEFYCANYYAALAELKGYN